MSHPVAMRHLRAATARRPYIILVSLCDLSLLDSKESVSGTQKVKGNHLVVVTGLECCRFIGSRVHCVCVSVPSQIQFRCCLLVFEHRHSNAKSSESLDRMKAMQALSSDVLYIRSE